MEPIPISRPARPAIVSVLAALLGAGCAHAPESCRLEAGGPLFIARSCDARLAAAWSDAADGQARQRAWLEENLREWDFYLRTVYEVRPADRAKWMAYLDKTAQARDAATLDPGRLEKTRRFLLANLDSGLGLLNTMLPVSRPIEVYLIPAVVQFDGKEFMNGERPAFALNLTNPALEDEEKTRALIVHEGAHVLHFGAQPAEEIPPLQVEQLGMTLREGLAVFVVKTLFPEKDEAFWTIMTPEFQRRCAAELPRNAAALLDDLSLPESSFDRKYFRSREDNDRIPPRCGYLIGARAVERMASKRPLSEILRMPGRDYRPLLLEALRGLAGR